MLDDIKAHVAHWENEGEVADYLTKILRKEANDGSGLIYGMGHAVYTLSDPRAVILKRKAMALAAGKEIEREFKLLDTIEKLTPELMKSVRGSDKVVCANVDMYSGLVYRMLGIPDELFTPLFATARMVGWAAHGWKRYSPESGSSARHTRRSQNRRSMFLYATDNTIEDAAAAVAASRHFAYSAACCSPDVRRAQRWIPC